MSRRVLLRLCTIAALLVTAISCTPTPGGAEPGVVEVTPEAPSAGETVPEEPVPTETFPEQAALQETYCDQSSSWIGVDFSVPEPESTGFWQGVLTSTGVYERENEAGIIVIEIIVRGNESDPILEYTKEALFCFEYVPLEPPTEEPVDEELFDTNELRLSILNDPAGENRGLVIEINPMTKPEGEQFEEGYGTKFVIDPRIAGGVPHDYARTCINNASARIEIFAPSGYGTVTGNLYKNNARIGNVTVNAGQSRQMNGAGRATYDLTVVGVARDSRYRVSGTWNRGYFSLPPGGGGAWCP